MRITFVFLTLAILFQFLSCTGKIIDEPVVLNNNSKRIDLLINISKKGASTYSGEDGSVDENHIDTIFVNIFENGSFIEARKFFGSFLERLSPTNDSIVRVAFEINGLSGGNVTAEVFANRETPGRISGEIALPENTPPTNFFMSGSSPLIFSGTAYSGTIHIIRNVAKLRINVSKHPLCIPSNLEVKYSDIVIEVQQAPDTTQLMDPPPITLSSADINYINYAPRTGASLRPVVPIASFTGGQLDSLYLNENYLDNYTNTNKTQVKIKIPEQEPGMPVKTMEYTYQLYTEGSYRIKRNYIYTLDIKIVGQSLEPVITLTILPWNDVSVDGSILGNALDIDRAVVNLNPVNTVSNAEKVNYKTDNTSITLDWNNINPAHNIDTTVQYIDGRDGQLEFFWTGDGAPDFDFKDTMYIVVGNIAKAVVLEYNVPKGTYGEWVGTFHRWNQTGERIIKMRNKGEWTATVTSGNDFIVLDGYPTNDANWGANTADLGNNSGFDSSHPVNSTSTTLTGRGIIHFRVGMTEMLEKDNTPPRYGLIEVTTNGGTKKIYVRQGEDADYIMRPSDLNPGDANKPRDYAFKFSPFNLADPNRGAGGNNVALHNDISYNDPVINTNKFTDYPTQAGYMFQWNLGDVSHKTYNPVNSITAISGWNDLTKNDWDIVLEPCPTGYRHPKDSTQSPAYSEIRQSWYAVPNSDTYLTPPSNVTLTNSQWGFYADGFFDRLPLVASPNGTDSTTVSYNSSTPDDITNTKVAYAGRLIYNPATNASIFLPAAGLRANTNGVLTQTGGTGAYWTKTNMNASTNAAWAYYFTPATFYSFGAAIQSSAINIRCVKDGIGLPGSPSP
jgi:hypothetical protein